MSMETDVSAALKAICPRAYPDVAPVGTVAPWLTWQGLGGSPIYYGDNTAADIRNTFLQVSVWSKTRLEALSMIRAVEVALCALPGMTITPQGEQTSTYEEATSMYGSIQRFSVWAAR